MSDNPFGEFSEFMSGMFAEAKAKAETEQARQEMVGADVQNLIDRLLDEGDADTLRAVLAMVSVAAEGGIPAGTVMGPLMHILRTRHRIDPATGAPLSLFGA